MSGFYEKCGDGAAILMSMKIRPTQARKPQRNNLHSVNDRILVRAETSVVINRLFWQLPSAMAMDLFERYLVKMPIINSLKIMMSRCVDIQGTRGLSPVGPQGALTDSYNGNHLRTAAAQLLNDGRLNVKSFACDRQSTPQKPWRGARYAIQ